MLFRSLLAPLLSGAARTGGYVVLSGILDHQAAEVRACYDEWFDMNFEQHEGGWVLLAGRRR